MGAAASVPVGALAGGILHYEVGSADVGLASAGFGARAQDASTVLTNPAGMARLEGTHLLLGVQVLYADLAFKPDAGISAGLGTAGGANVGLLWEPGAHTRLGLTYSSQVKLDFSARPEVTGLSAALQLLLRARGLDTATVDPGVQVPQAVMLSAFHQLNDQWALLASAGCQPLRRLRRHRDPLRGGQPRLEALMPAAADTGRRADPAAVGHRSGVAVDPAWAVECGEGRGDPGPGEARP